MMKFSNLLVAGACLFCLTAISRTSAQPVLDAPDRPGVAPVAPRGELQPRPGAAPQQRSLTSGIRNLYRIPLLREKLGGVTEEQTAKLNVFLDDVDQDVFKLREKYRGMPPTPETHTQFQEDTLVVRNKMMKGLQEILSKEQMDNIAILQFQLLGGFDAPLMNREVLNVLGLSEETTKKILDLGDARQKALLEESKVLRESKPETPQQGQEIMNAFRRRAQAVSRDYGAKIRECLTPEQRERVEKWEKDGEELREELKKMPAPDGR